MGLIWEERNGLSQGELEWGDGRGNIYLAY